MKAKQRETAKEWIQSILVSVVSALLIITFIGQSFVVEGSSMLPNLHDGDRLLVEKVSYRFRDPLAGEVVVLRYPSDPRARLIKRIIGVPGDSIAIADGRVHVNGVPVEETYINDPMVRWQRIGPLTVPEDHYFVLGDNRNASKDSRDPTVGFIPKSLIVGRALVRYWPLNQIGSVEAFAPHPEPVF